MDRKLFCELTNFLDGYTRDFDIIKNCFSGHANYLDHYETRGNEEIYSIRVPGATRGHVILVEGIVKEIEIYDLKVYCYTLKPEDMTEVCMKRFKGMKLELHD